MHVDIVCLQLVEAFSREKATVEAHRGGSFSLMDGMITGEFLECTRPSKIVQKWRLRSWPEGVCVCDGIKALCFVCVCMYVCKQTLY